MNYNLKRSELPSLCLAIALLLFQSSIAVSAAENRNLYFKSLMVEDGLSQNMVYSILQDRLGFMWFATQDGLNRYDGSSFKIYKQSNDCGLKTDAFFSLREDNNANMWIGTDDGVYVYDPLKDHFTSYDNASPDGQRIEGIVRDMEIDRHGNVWIAASGKGVFKVSPDGNLTCYSLDKYVEPNHNLIRDICINTDDVIWVATYGNGLLKLDPDSGTSTQILIDAVSKNQNDNDINEICALDKYRLLIGTVNRGLLMFDMRSGKFESVCVENNECKPLFVRSIYMNQAGEIWLGAESGLYICSIQSGTAIHLQHIFNDPFSLSDNAIHSICQDREGGMWVGTYFGGVNYFSPTNAQFEKYYPVTGRNSISGKNISEFCEDDRGNIWIGTEDVGLCRFDPDKCIFTKMEIGADNIHALMYDNGKLWIGSFAEGLFVLDIKSGKVINYRSKADRKSLNNNSIYSIHKTQSGEILIGTMTGLCKYVPHTDNFVRLQDSVIISQVNDIEEDFDSVLYFATLGQGLFSYDGKSDRWQHYYSVVESDTVHGKMVSCITEDTDFNLWVGTHGAGMVCYNKRERCFTKHYSVRNGLPNNVVYEILQDDNGLIWGSTNKGLFRFDPDTNDIKEYTHANGLLGDQFNYKSGLKSKSGKMYFGGVKGLVAFDPLRIKYSDMAPKVVFNSFQLYNREVNADEKDSPLQYSITQTKRIVLSFRQSIFSLGFATLSYSPSQGTHYAYKLDGWDREWIQVGQYHRVTYSNLPAGKYVFNVRAVNDDGLWSPQNASVEIIINPPFYKTTWAYLCYALLLALIFHYLWHMYSKRLKKRNAEALEQLERNKQKELYDAKIAFFTNVTHEIRTPLSLIKAPLDVVMKVTDSSDVRYDNMSIIDRNTNRLLKLVNELLDFRKAEANGLNLNFTKVDMVRVLKDTMIRFSASIQLKRLELRQEFPFDEFIVDADAEICTKIVSNLLSNALKHAESFIMVKIESRGDQFRLTVLNDGTKVPCDKAEQIFLPFVKLDEHSQGTGIGLPFARTLTEAHNGRIWVDTQNQYTAFVVEMPVHQTRSIQLLDERPAVETGSRNVYTIERKPKIENKTVILTVEDNDEFQDFIVSQLSGSYLVLRAKNGRQALEILQTEQVGIVVSDVMMPVMDGIELCNKIKENLRYSHIPVILLTAKTGVQAQIEGLRAGADEYIAKPFSIDFLQARIENLLESRRKIREAYRQSPDATVDAIANSKADQEFLNNLVKVIHEHIDNTELDVETLAMHMNMSRATLYRKVKSVSELTPNDFIRLVRLKKAAELIRAREYRINEIAFIVGFSSPSYFSKCFYKQFGIIPKDFVK